MMLGLLLGLAAGVGLAFLREQLDNTLKTPEEAERYLHLPNLGDGARFRGDERHRQWLCFAAGKVRASRVAGFGA